MLKMIVTACHILYTHTAFAGIRKMMGLKSVGFDFLPFGNMKMAFTSGIGFAELGRVFSYIAIKSPRPRCCEAALIVHLSIL